MASPPCESGEPSDLSTASSSATGNTTLDQEDTYENTATINHAAIVDIDIGAPTPRDSLTTRTPSIDDLIRLGPSAIMKCARQGGTSLRWVHLRTNCMHFVEDLMAKVVEERGLPMPEPCQSPPAKTNPILRKDLWSNLFHGKASHQTQARFMGPTYTQFALQLEDEESDSNALPRGSTDNIVLYLPYLNWESCKSWTERQALIQAISENMPGEVQPDLNFVKKYLHHKTAPFHDRRSLHQAYYHDFGMTRPLSRYEQVIQRFTSQTHPEAAKMIVVDQLWLWVIRGVDIAEDGETTSHPDLVITAFPERFNGAYDSANIYSGIIDHLRRGLQPPLRTANHLVAVILEHCTGVFFQRQLEQDKWFLEFFAAAVGTVRDDQKSAFNDFCLVSKELKDLEDQRASPIEISGKLEDTAFSISVETNLVKSIKDIIDELGCIDYILKRQQDVVGQLTRSQRSRSLQTTFEIVKERRETWAEIAITARSTHTDIQNQMDLKQKQANLSESRSSRHQAEDSARNSRTILLFTIVTIIFLPLSFMTTWFGMNVRDPDAGNLSLNAMATIIFPVSIVIALVALLFAFSERLRSLVVEGAEGVVCFVMVALGVKGARGWSMRGRQRRRRRRRRSMMRRRQRDVMLRDLGQEEDDL